MRLSSASFLPDEVETYTIEPEQLGVRRGRPEEIKALETHEENAKAALRILMGIDRSTRRDLILLNASAVLYLCEVVKDLKDRYELAANTIDSGEAVRKLEQLVLVSRGDINRLKRLLASI